MQHRTITLPAGARSLGATDGEPIELRLVEAGAGGVPLLLVHGFTGNRSDFVDAVDGLAVAGWHVVVPDLRGHGESAKPQDEAAYSFGVFAADVLALADALGWDRFVLLGHSLGGMVAQEVAIGAGHRLLGLVLMDTSHGPVPVDPDLVAFAVAVARDAGIEGVADAVAALGEDGPLTTEADRRLRRERPGWIERGDTNLRACSPAMYAAMAQAITGRPDRLAALAAVTVPTLVVVGEHDELFLGPSRAMAEALPVARLAVVPTAGHSPQFEAPDAWAATLLAFLAEVRPAVDAV